jgi:PmbA protein
VELTFTIQKRFIIEKLSDVTTVKLHLMLKIDDLVSYAHDSAKQLGIEKFDIYGATVDGNSVQVDEGEPKQVKASNRSTVTVRVWNQEGTVGITSTTDVDPVGVRLALQTAHEASFFGATQHVPDFSPEAKAPIAALPDQTAPQAPIAELIDKLLAAEKDLLSAHDAIKGVPYHGLSQSDSTHFYLNSEGAARSDSHSSSSIYLYSKTEQEGKKPRSAGAYRVSRSLAELDIQGCLQETVEKTISHLHYEKVPSGKYLVVFSPEAFLSLLGAFSNLFNAQSILDKQSLSTPESLGTQIAVPLLSVYDDALHQANIGAETFDGEGTPTRRVALIDQGVLTGFLHSAGTAKRMNAQPTGHANMGAKVTVSPNFYHVLAGTAESDIYRLDVAEDVIFVDDLHALHAGVQSLEGSFSLPFDGWMLNKGKKVSIDSATVAGDFRTLLQSIVHVEPQEKLTPGGVSPHIWVKDLSITGE